MDQNSIEYRVDYKESKGDTVLNSRYFDTEDEARTFIKEKRIFAYKLVQEIPLGERVDPEWETSEEI